MQDDTYKALTMGQALVCAFCIHSIRYWIYTAFLQMALFFNPHLIDKENESHQVLAVDPRSHREPVAEPRFKPRKFASKIYVLNHYFMSACLSKQGIETGLTPNFTSVLIALCKDKSVILGGDIHSFTQTCAGRLQHAWPWAGQWGQSWGGVGSLPIPLVISAMNIMTTLSLAPETCWVLNT